jgi:YVTN family beta-propeller protein
MIHPAGKSLEFGGRPFDLLLSPDGKSLYVKGTKELLVIDTAAWNIRQNLRFAEGDGSMHGMAVTRDGSRLYVTTSQNIIWEVNVAADGKVDIGRKIVLPGVGGKPDDSSCICGIALSSDEKTAYACRSRCNTLGVIDLASGKMLKDIPVGIAPYAVLLSHDGHTAYVSNLGGRHPMKTDKTSDSSGTKCVVDERGICSSGTVSVVDLSQGRERERTQIETGLHPTDMKLSSDGRTLYVANANSDTLSVIDTRRNRVTDTVSVRPVSSLPFGSAPNAIAMGRDGNTLYVANGGNNAVAVVQLHGKKKNEASVQGFIPAAWYPGAVATDGNYLYIANVKGFGSRWKNPANKGWTSWDIEGSITKVQIPKEDLLREYTARVKADGRIPQILRAMERAQTGKKAVPVPERTGEPSVFQHVVYIIKENKTYDQVFGDMGRGNSDPDLCVYTRKISPNHHALADDFVLLDNYYCNGVCSADGHCWTTEGNTTDYQEKEFGGFTRYYGDDSDCLDISSSGFIWDDAVSHGLSFRNYGEFGFGKTSPDSKWQEAYKDLTSKAGKIKYSNEEMNETLLKRYSCPEYPGWNLAIPDAIRTEIFIKELAECEKNNDLPNLITLYLPSDHTSGGQPGFPTPRAQVADNDLALGKIIEAISKSRFWPETCIFVEEDDSQSGLDHVDGHRSICLVISPYTKRGALVSDFYNQTAVLHTMERILGIPPMNQMDAMAPVMSNCFSAKPDFGPYTCIPNNIPLDEMSSSSALFYGRDKYLASGGKDNPFAEPDRINDDELNRVLWYFAKGPDVPYPSEYAGPHGKGLAALHLKLDADMDD